MTMVSAFDRRYARMRTLVDRRLALLSRGAGPRTMTEACRHVLQGGGKRVRSTLVLLSCEAVGGRAGNAVDAGAAVELLHNFTLVHDDIMDRATSRRGRPTVHTKWNQNVALLAGDILLGMGYERLLSTRGANAAALTGVYTRGLLDVCRGQGLDMEFEQTNRVSVRQYFTMIELKTARLLATSTELGARIGGGTPAEIRALRTFGRHLGIAFQLNDDLLDVIGEERDFGKAIGGDIVEGKKTFLYLTALARASRRDAAILRASVRKNKARSARTRVKTVTGLYRTYDVTRAARDAIQRETNAACAALHVLRPGSARDMLTWFADRLVSRTS